MTDFKPQLKACGVGSLPHADPKLACDLVLKYMPDIPTWPEMPRRSPLESMYIQFVSHFPGVVIEDGKITVDTTRDLGAGLEKLYGDYIEDNTTPYLPGPEYAVGLTAMLNALQERGLRLDAIKGQITGPISQGLQMTDQNLRPVLYDEILADALSKYIALGAAEQEKFMAQMAPTTILFLSERYLSAFGSAFFAVSRELVVRYLEEVFGKLHGLKGVHCCGNTDWSILLATTMQVLNFDAYNYAETIALYPREIKDFLNRGGIIAWGIVPANDGDLAKENVESLDERLVAAMNLLVAKGVSFDRLLGTSLITPSCGFGSISKEGAVRGLELLHGLSARLRERYFGEKT